MKDYGVIFGEVPLNLYFWNTLRGMASPMEYAAQMSLTFEQANLDFALEYEEIFEKELGDTETADLLKRVHDDEIRHVSHGWRWFCEWNPGESSSDFERYRRVLPFPMSPRRARGSRFFSEESRRRAGLSDEFIREIRIAGGSRGRVPKLYHFNPQCEVEETWTTLPGHVSRRVRDLEPLMLWMGLEEDCIEQSHKPPGSFLEMVHRIRGFLPEVLSDPKDFERHPIFEEFRPWGFSPGAWRRMDSVPAEWRTQPRFSRELHREKLFSKGYWKRVNGHSEQVLSNAAEVDDWLGRARRSGQAVLIKSDRGTSGRGHLKLEADGMHDPGLRAKILKRISREGILIAEPWHEKIADFSVQYEILPGGEVMEYEPRRFFTDRHFQYRGASLGRVYGAGREDLEIIFRNEVQWRDAHRRVLAHLQELGYQGPLGIDALIAHTPGGPAIVPIIEVNVRFTMGRVAIEIERAVRRSRPFHNGVWRLFGRSELLSLGAVSFSDLDRKLTENFGDRYFPTSPPEVSEEVWSGVILDPKPGELPQSWGFSAT